MTELTPRQPAPYDVKYPTALGKLVANLAVLEFAIRTTLYLLDTPREQRLPPTFRVANLNVGDETPETWLTNWRYFTDLITEYNRRCGELGRQGIDPTLGDLRNGLAHGSIISASVDEPLTLIRYARPRESMVRVTEKHVMTLDWITAQSGRVFQAAAFVFRHLNELR